MAMFTCVVHVSICIQRLFFCVNDLTDHFEIQIYVIVGQGAQNTFYFENAKHPELEHKVTKGKNLEE